MYRFTHPFLEKAWMPTVAPADQGTRLRTTRDDAPPPRRCSYRGGDYLRRVSPQMASYARRGANPMAGAPCGKKDQGPLAALHIVARFAGTSPLPPPIVRADNGGQRCHGSCRGSHQDGSRPAFPAGARTRAASPHAASVAVALPRRTRPREAIHLRPLSGERGGWRSSASTPRLCQ